ncbi:MAG: protein phosphatase 2C domain-containing protein [Candidatus Cloacimonadales bacterium]
MKYYGKSQPGTKSIKNEDSFVLPEGIEINGTETFKIEPDLGQQGYLLAICDGMGGHQAGEIASRLATSWLWKDFYTSPNIENMEEWIKQEITSINSRLFNLSVEHEVYNGMGTTIVGVIIKNNKLYSFNVGDSRCYLLIEDKIEQITADDSEVWKLYKQGLLTKDELVNNKKGHLITQAIALSPTVEVHTYAMRELTAGTKILLCSDGVHDVLIDSRIKEIVALDFGLEEITLKLIEEAVKADSKDDITAIIIEV